MVHTRAYIACLAAALLGGCGEDSQNASERPSTCDGGKCDDVHVSEVDAPESCDDTPGSVCCWMQSSDEDDDFFGTQSLWCTAIAGDDLPVIALEATLPDGDIAARFLEAHTSTLVTRRFNDDMFPVSIEVRRDTAADDLAFDSATSFVDTFVFSDGGAAVHSSLQPWERWTLSLGHTIVEGSPEIGVAFDLAGTPIERTFFLGEFGELRHEVLVVPRGATEIEARVHNGHDESVAKFEGSGRYGLGPEGLRRLEPADATRGVQTAHCELGGTDEALVLQCTRERIEGVSSVDLEVAPSGDAPWILEWSGDEATLQLDPTALPVTIIVASHVSSDIVSFERLPAGPIVQSVALEKIGDDITAALPFELWSMTFESDDTLLTGIIDIAPRVLDLPWGWASTLAVQLPLASESVGLSELRSSTFAVPLDAQTLPAQIVLVGHDGEVLEMDTELVRGSYALSSSGVEPLE